VNSANRVFVTVSRPRVVGCGRLSTALDQAMSSLTYVSDDIERRPMMDGSSSMRQPFERDCS
jgi:hypothetical protein